MKILIVNTYDRGGAAIACKNLHKGLLAEGVDSHLLLKNQQNKWLSSSVFEPIKVIPSLSFKLQNRLKRIFQEIRPYKYRRKSIDPTQVFLENRQEGLEMFSFPQSQIDITESDYYKTADIVNLHWVANFLDYQSFFEKNTKPVVWTLHDMNPFTGGEHYEEKFIGISEEGYPIKREVTRQERKIHLINLRIKKQAIKEFENLTIISPSKWLKKEAIKSKIFNNKKIIHIPNGVDSQKFSPRNKDFSRGILELPKDKKVILFVADSINNNRKGFIFLKRALEEISTKNLILCTIGNQDLQLGNSIDIHSLGPFNDDRLLSIAYSAADVFVIPSLMDNLPNTVLESLMCGTPVIGFPVGGIPEMIEEGINGMLCQDISVSSLLKTLEDFLTSMGNFDRTKIRKMAVKRYGLEVQANNYIKVFKEIVEKQVD